jgi:hypothetical protein
MRFLTFLLVLINLTITGGAYADPSTDKTTPKATKQATKEPIMTIRGTFDVKMLSKDPDAEHTTGIGRLLLDKTYHGALEATSQGQMLGFRSEVEGSAGYVAMEQVTGTLDGRTGSFVLQHGAVMSRGVTPALTAVVVPDSGTEELTGLAGELDIVIEDGQHLYEFRYTLGGE